MAESTAYKISQDEIDWAYHLSYDRAETDYKNGIRIAVEKAQIEKAEMTALNFLKMNLLSVEQIAQAIDLPVERVKELALTLKQ